MSTITKERLRERAREKVKSLEFTVTQTAFADTRAELEEELELARIALASLEAEPAAYIRSAHNPDGFCFADGIHPTHRHQRPPLSTLQDGCYWKVTPLYTAPPAPVSVPGEVSWEDVPEDITEDDMALASAWAHGFNQCRAAMLKHSEPFIVTSDHRMMEMPQVEAINAVTAMIQGVVYAETPTTMQTAPALDSSPKIAELPSGNSPVIPDGWVACVERMPDQFKAILAFNEYGEVWSGAYDRHWNFYCDNLLVEHVTHWMPLPAAPQQEA